MTQKRIIVMQDISCFGKCSLTIALPVISSAGVTCCPLPTALLSAHTGGLGEVAFFDLSEETARIMDHWERLSLGFDGIYIGYLGSRGQITLAKRLIERFRRPDTFVLVDPVMGDGGALYKRFDADYVREMRPLAAMADYLLPNITEAALLCGFDYPGENLRPEEAAALLGTAAGRYPGRFVITGVAQNKDEIGAAACRRDAAPFYSAEKRRPGRFHGTGDLFASVMTAALARGCPLERAVALGVACTGQAIDNTISAFGHPSGGAADERHGLLFEPLLSALTQLCSN